MKYSKFWILALLACYTFLACSDDDDAITPVIETVDFGTAPSSGLIASGTVDVVTESTIRYHVINFTNAPYTVTVVETEGHLVIVDLGPAPNFAMELRSYTDAINKPGSVIITHNHGDHYGGAGSYADYDFYAESVVANQLNSTSDFVALYSSDVIGVERERTIGELIFAFDKVSNAETGENGYVYNEEHEIVFAGDLVYNLTHPFLREYTPNDDIDEIDNWVDGLATLKTRFSDYTHIFVGHNAYRSDVSTVLNENIGYLQTAQQLIKGTRALSNGDVATSQQEIIDELQALYPNYLVGGLLLSLPDAFFPGDPGADWF